MRVGLLAGVALVALGCASEPEHPLVVSDDPELLRMSAEVLPELVRRSGLELREPVRVSRRSRAELFRYLEAQLDEELPAAEAAAVAESYHLLGLLPEGVDLRRLLLGIYTEQVAGFYDPDSTALFVLEDQPEEAVRTVLVHELVHAVQDQSVDLDSLISRERGNDRQAAAQAAIEGQATLVMFEFLTAEGDAPPDFAARIRPALEAMRGQYPELAQAPRIVQESLLFPYLEGTAFVERLWSGIPGRPSPLGEHLPRSTEQVTAEGFDDEPTELQLEFAGAQRYTNTLGAMETKVLLEELVGPDAGSAARGWDGDRYVLVDAPDGSALAWWSVWDDQAARDRFVDVLGPALDRLPRPARIERRVLDGRPAALLEVGAPGTVAARIVEDDR